MSILSIIKFKGFNFVIQICTLTSNFSLKNENCDFTASSYISDQCSFWFEGVLLVREDL